MAKCSKVVICNPGFLGIRTKAMKEDCERKRQLAAAKCMCQSLGSPAEQEACRALATSLYNAGRPIFVTREDWVAASGGQLTYIEQFGVDPDPSSGPTQADTIQARQAAVAEIAAEQRDNTILIVGGIILTLIIGVVGYNLFFKT